MARRLDEYIEVSALCMDLALAGEMHRRALAAAAKTGAGSLPAESEPERDSPGWGGAANAGPP
jgi:hypothetical protein